MSDLEFVTDLEGESIPTTVIDLSDDQDKAINEIMVFLENTETEHVLTGGPGVGKTFTVRYLVDKVTERSNGRVPISLTATTNKAAAVLSEMTGIAAQTIHKFLGLSVKNDYKTGKTVLKKGRQLPYLKSNGLWILDESSMIDEPLHKIVLEYADYFQCKVLYVGDAYQLPPVFCTIGSIFKHVKNISELNTIHRQGKTSSILTEAAKFREIIKTQNPEFQQIYSSSDITILNPDDFHAQMKETFTSEEYKADVDHAKVLAWRNVTVNHYSDFVRGFFYSVPEPVVGEYLIVSNTTNNEIKLRTEDMVEVTNVHPGTQHGVTGHWLQVVGENDSCRVFLANNYEDVKLLLKQKADEAKKPRNNWREYFQTQADFISMRPVYASTVHKAQGGSMDIIFLDLDDVAKNTKWNEVARLVYVALTRARHHVYITGELPEYLLEN